MSLLNKIFGDDQPEDIAAMRAADKALHDNQRAEEAAGIREETPEYLRLNRSADRAASKVSRWRGGTRTR